MEPVVVILIVGSILVITSIVIIIRLGLNAPL